MVYVTSLLLPQNTRSGRLQIYTSASSTLLLTFWHPQGTGSSFYFYLFSIALLFSNYKCAFSKRCILTDCNLCLLGFKMGCKYLFIVKPQNSSGPYIENWQSIKSNFRTKDCSGYIQCHNKGLNGKMLNNQVFSCI